MQYGVYDVCESPISYKLYLPWTPKTLPFLYSPSTGVLYVVCVCLFMCVVCTPTGAGHCHHYVIASHYTIMHNNPPLYVGQLLINRNSTCFPCAVGMKSTISPSGKCMKCDARSCAVLASNVCTVCLASTCATVLLCLACHMSGIYARSHITHTHTHTHPHTHPHTPVSNFSSHPLWCPLYSSLDLLWELWTMMCQGEVMSYYRINALQNTQGYLYDDIGLSVCW